MTAEASIIHVAAVRSSRLQSLAGSEQQEGARQGRLTRMPPERRTRVCLL